MKWFRGIIIFLIILYWGIVLKVNYFPLKTSVLTEPKKESFQEQKISESISTPVAMVQPIVSPSITSVPEKISSVEPRRVAPKGVFYVISYISITTDSGVIDVSPGTKVTLVSSGPPMRVTDGENVFEILPSQVTNDLDIANHVINSNQAAQAKIAEASARDVQAYDKQQKESLHKQDAANQAQINQSKNNEAQRQARIMAIRSEIDRIREGSPSSSRAFVNPAIRDHIQRATNKRDQRIRELQEELSRLGVAGSAFQ